MPATVRSQSYIGSRTSSGAQPYGGRYTWSDADLDADEVREKVRGYQDRYDIPTEQLR